MNCYVIVKCLLTHVGKVNRCTAVRIFNYTITCSLWLFARTMLNGWQDREVHGRNYLGGGYFLSTFFPFFPLYFSRQSDPSNPGKGFGKAVLAFPSGEGRTTFTASRHASSAVNTPKMRLRLSQCGYFCALPRSHLVNSTCIFYIFSREGMTQNTRLMVTLSTGCL